MSENKLNLLGLFNTKKTREFTIKFKALDKNGELKTIKFRFQTHNENDRLLIKTFMQFVNAQLMLNNCEPIVVGEPLSIKGKNARLQETCERIVFGEPLPKKGNNA